jgi:hypothetical protein
MSEHVRCYVRFRPTTGDAAGGATAHDAATGNVVVAGSGAAFRYTGVLDASHDNAAVFDTVVAPLVADTLRGVHACVLCYGQTGSGKTHTAFGGGGDAGVVRRAIAQLFAASAAERATRRSRLAVSYYEVYNETVNDLLAPGAGRLDVRETAGGVTFVDGLSVRLCHSAAAAERLLAVGTANKTVGQSYVHDRSSRAHTVFNVHFAAEDNVRRAASSVLSKLTFVDLAGSELLSADFGAAQQAETKNINLSLLALKRVMAALAAAEPFVPYRESVLTRLLAQGLSVHGRTAVLVAASDEPRHAAMTAASLKFGDVAGAIQQRATLHQLVRAAPPSSCARSSRASSSSARRARRPWRCRRRCRASCRCTSCRSRRHTSRRPSAASL